ncbi:hypothetical protein Noda2021_06300 [Candidatus Dependentiae bacterium Noda2021]|nr:hypothetical protein Noda2021_06300 [Candidatus Dependentiae bacterium Noda2021]
MNVCRLLFFLIAPTWSLLVQATLLVTGDAGTSSAFTFTAPVTTKAYDHASGTLFLGLAGGSTYSLSKIPRFNGSTTPVATPIGTGISGNTLEFLTLSTYIGNTQPNLVLSTQNGANPLTQTFFYVSNINGTLASSAAVGDANGATTSGIAGIAAGPNYSFLPVRPTGGANFGALGSGIALALLTPSTSNTVPRPPATPTLLNANTGAVGNVAAPLDGTSTVLRGAGTDPVLFQTGTNTNQVATLWDQPLRNAYFGFRITTGANAGEIGKAVTLAFTNPNNNALNIVPITPDSAISAPGTDEIVVTKDSNQSITIKKIGVMHTSTGPSYLIVQGGLGTTLTIGNRIWALPLVDQSVDSSTNGTLANKNSPLVNYKFITPALAPGELANTTDAFATVGAGPLPLAQDGTVFDMVVAGDTVYASIATASNATSDSGIFYSQAHFDQTGKIAGWTPWTKRAFPASGFPNNLQQTGVSFFDVDAVTSTIWAVDGQTRQILRTTAWNSSNSTPCSLLNRLNQSLSGCSSGSCSVLDLDQATRGFETNTTSRFALFGGRQKVVFALVSTAQTASTTSPQIVTTDFCIPGNYLETTLPDGAGTVTSLEYSRRLFAEGATNYFFAGTERGLYAFADAAGNGFVVNELTNLTNAPFNGMWFAIPTIPGAIIDIKSDGTQLYVLTREFDPTNLFKSTLYSISYTTNISTMFGAANIIAQSATGSLSGTRLFTAIELIEDQIVLATNKGLYRTTTVGGAQLATDQVTAAWASVGTQQSYYNALAALDSAVPLTSNTTIWALSLQSDSLLNTFENGTIEQLNGTISTADYAFVPPYFISTQQLTDPLFAVLPPLTYFWTDGNRRLLVGANGYCKTGNSLFSLPFNTLEWRVPAPDQTIITNAIVTPNRTINWIKQIGVTGLLLMGTNKGILSLE